MPYGTITVNTKSFEPRTPGTYILNTLTFGQPTNEFRIRGATKGKDNIHRSSVIRLIEKDVIVNGTIVRKSAFANFALAVPPIDFTAAEIDGMALDLSEFLTVATITRLMQGES